MFPFFKKSEAKSRNEVKELKAFVSGRVIPIEEVPDEVFSSKILGGGLAIEPEENVIIAPCDGVISVVMNDSKHAVGMRLDNGAEILIHEGLDTVSMADEGFDLYVKEGQHVKEGERLLAFDKDKIRSRGLPTICICVLSNESDFPGIKYLTGTDAKQGKTVIVKFDSY